MSKSVVAILKTVPEQVLEDIPRLMEMAGLDMALDAQATTILKDNISWHYPFLSANTTPWQLEGAILGLKKAGLGLHMGKFANRYLAGGCIDKISEILKHEKGANGYEPDRKIIANHLYSACP